MSAAEIVTPIIVRVRKTLFGERRAVFSPCERYRYLLRIPLGYHGAAIFPTVAFCMLNPSTADEMANDRTVAGCCEFARRLGFETLLVVNLFALRSTVPETLYDTDDPVGPMNDQYMREAFKQSNLCVAAWGNHGGHLGRDRAACAAAKTLGVKFKVLAINEKTGQPKHPLYVRRSTVPVDWESA